LDKGDKIIHKIIDNTYANECKLLEKTDPRFWFAIVDDTMEELVERTNDIFLPVNNAQSSGRDYAISNKIAPTNSITVNGFELIT
jgi:hypothetical protein